MQRIYTRFILFIFIGICGLSFPGCNVINPPERIPTYIHIDSFHVNRTLNFPNATTSSQITTVWAYYNNSLIGTYDLPVTFPIITTSDTGAGQLELIPGISIDGLNNLLGQYPFYQPDTFTFKAQPGKIITHIPQVSYYTGVNVTPIANFEGFVNFGLASGDQPMLTVTQINDPGAVFEGLGSGSITLHAVGDSSEDSSFISFPIPSGAAFIEFNYKSTIPFYVGLSTAISIVGISTNAYYLTGINPSATWQKFYLSVADFNAQFKGTSYKLYIKAVLGTGQTSGQLLLDNIQLVTF